MAQYCDQPSRKDHGRVTLVVLYQASVSLPSLLLLSPPLRSGGGLGRGQSDAACFYPLPCAAGEML